MAEYAERKGLSAALVKYQAIHPGLPASWVEQAVKYGKRPELATDGDLVVFAARGICEQADNLRKA